MNNNLFAFISLEKQIIVPFGKGSEEEEIIIHLRNTNKTGFELFSDMPCVEINTEEGQAVRLFNICEIFSDPLPYINDSWEAFQFVRKFLLDKLQGLREIQVDFLNLYFNCIATIGKDLNHKHSWTKRVVLNYYNLTLAALFPLANAHLFTDPRKDSLYTDSGKILADILFWTGQRFIAFELVDDNDLRIHMERIRILLENDIDTIILFEEEMKRDRENALRRHLPPEILNFWLNFSGEPYNPLFSPF